MESTNEKLTATLTAALDAIKQNIDAILTTTDLAEKQKLADIVRILSESQKHIAESIDLLTDDDFGDSADDDFFDDTFFDDNDDDLNGLMDTKQISFKKNKQEKKKSGKKEPKGLDDEDPVF